MKHIILIPYRNRERHLEYFLKNSVPLLKKYFEDLKIIIIEQGNDKLFNRGMLLNIGFKEYDADYYFTHDVDLNPTEICIENYYIQNNEGITGIYTSCYNTLGGIIKFSKNVFLSINGFPNNFWGWGVEDKAIQNRAEFKNIEITKNILNNDPNRFKYFTIFNDVDDRKKDNVSNKHNIEYNIFNKMNSKQKDDHIMSSGLNTLEFKLIKKEIINENIEKITVDI